jgi:uroporphyrinogen III methyltransferase / synthase
VSVPDPAAYSLICFTSPNGVRIFFELLGSDSRSLAGVRVAAIGPGTAAALEKHGIAADIVPERFVAEGLLEALEDEPLEGRRVLVARAAEARDVLPDGLRERGAEVDVVALYETVAEPLGAAQIESLAGATHVTFTSSSTVHFFLEGGGRVGAARVVSIGPVTSETLRERGLQPHVEAARHDIDGLIAAIVEDVGR